MNMNRSAKINLVLFFIAAIVGMEVLILLAHRNDNAGAENEDVWLGIETMELSPAIMAQYDIRSSSGLLVSRVFAGSPAQISGIKTGDILRKWNGVSITSQDKLQKLLGRAGVNQRIKLTVDRKGTPVSIAIQLGLRPGNR